MHVIVGLADTAAATVLEWERIDSDLVSISPHVMVRKSESGVI